MTKQYTEDEIKLVADALKQVVSVNPQLLYKAAQQVSANCSLEAIQESFQEQPNKQKYEKIMYRASLCGWIANLLLRSGRAQLDADDLANVAFYAQFQAGAK